MFEIAAITLAIMTIGLLLLTMVAWVMWVMWPEGTFIENVLRRVFITSVCVTAGVALGLLLDLVLVVWHVVFLFIFG